MSKKRFILFALVTALVLSFAGSAFAADTFVWIGPNDGGSWEGLNNWRHNGATPAANVPAAADDVTIPTNVTSININSAAVAAQIRIEGARSEVPVRLVIAATRSLTLTTVAAANVPVGGQIYAESSLQITGEGTFVYTDVAGDGDLVVNTVGEETVVDFNIRVAPTAGANVANLLKTGTGVVTFTNTLPNTLGENDTITIQDGVLGIIRPDLLTGNAPAATPVALDDGNVLGRNPVFRTLWTGSENLDGIFTIDAVTNGTIDVSVEGSTFNVNGNGANHITSTSGIVRQITKTGPGTLSIGGAAGKWGSAADEEPSLFIEQGEVRVTRNNAIEEEPAGTGTIPVNVANGATFRLNAGIAQAITALTAEVENAAQLDATLRLLEGSVLTVGDDTDYPGCITGTGSLTIAGDAVISGTRNDYSGDTTVTTDGELTLSHANNLGGTRAGQLRLTPGDGVVGATVVIDDESNFVLPNVVVIGNANGTATYANNGLYGVGGVTVTVPADTSFEIAGNIDYNQNFIAKNGLGNLILSNVGRNSVGNGTFDDGTANRHTVTLALQINNGRVRIDNDTAADYGDIWVGGGNAAAIRPVLSVRNGILLNSSIYFNDESTFETEILPLNYGEGTGVTPAVDVRGQIRGDAATQPNFRVYNRINFLDLQSGTVTKGSRFQIMRGFPFRDYSTQNVWPIEWDAQTKAPFTGYISDNYLFFEATHNIDVPVFTAPTTTTAVPGTNYRIVIPVTTTTSLRAETLSVAGLPGAAATLNATGTEIIITGPAPALDEGEEERVLRYTVTVSSGSAGETLGYEHHEEYTLTITNNGGVTPPPPPTGPALSANPAVSLDITAQEITGTLRFAVDGTPTAATANIRLYKGATSGDPLKAQTGVPIPAAGYALSNLKASDVSADFAYEYDTDYIVAVEIPASNITETFKVRVDTAKPPKGSGSSGCDAGFGAFALLAAAGAVTLLRKEG